VAAGSTPELVRFGRQSDVGLRRTLVSGSTILVGARAVVLVLQTAIGIALARLLGPSDFGLVGMVTAVLNFALIFRDMGLSYATVQRKDLSEQELSNLFWLNIGFGACSTLAVAALAPVIQWFYGADGLGVLVLALCVGFFLNAASVQHAALLRRRFRFGELAVADLGSVAIAGVAAVLLALGGLGVWALVAQQVARALAFLVFVVLFAAWRPRRPRRAAGTASHLKFGAEILSFEVVNYVGQNLDKIVIGKFFGPSILGYFTRAQELVLLPISQIRGPMATAAVPALASAQDDAAEYGRAFLLIVKINSVAAVPFLVLAALEARTLIPLILGEHWSPSVPFLRILSVSGVPMVIAGILGTHLIATGDSRRYVNWGTCRAFVLGIGVVVGIPFGAIGIAASLAVTNWLVFVPSVLYVLHRGHVRAVDFFKVSTRPLVFAALSAGLVLLSRQALHLNPLPSMLAEVCLFCSGYATQAVVDPDFRSVAAAVWSGHRQGIARL